MTPLERSPGGITPVVRPDVGLERLRALDAARDNEMAVVAEVAAVLALEPVYRPSVNTLKHFLRTLGTQVVMEAARMAAERTQPGYQAFRYLCGVCWNLLRPERAMETLPSTAVGLVAAQPVMSSSRASAAEPRNARRPSAFLLADILPRAEAITAPRRAVELGYGEPEQLLLRVCIALADSAAPGPFFIAARAAGELVGLHFTEASAVLRAAVADGFLELVERGSGARASRYRWIGQRDGEQP